LPAVTFERTAARPSLLVSCLQGLISTRLFT
jgi:hypothetical protein